MATTGTAAVLGIGVLGVLGALGALAGCGARSALEEPRIDGGATPVADAGPPRDCGLVECTIGHACCLGGCGGPAVPTTSDCCPCLPGEVSSEECGGMGCAE
jgi:hypothetical protein